MRTVFSKLLVLIVFVAYLALWAVPESFSIEAGDGGKPSGPADPFVCFDLGDGIQFRLYYTNEEPDPSCQLNLYCGKIDADDDIQQCRVFEPAPA